MNIEGKSGVGTNRLHHPVADVDSGHKLPVHDINMEIVSTSPGSLSNLLA